MNILTIIYYKYWYSDYVTYKISLGSRSVVTVLSVYVERLT